MNWGTRVCDDQNLYSRKKKRKKGRRREIEREKKPGINQNVIRVIHTAFRTQSKLVLAYPPSVLTEAPIKPFPHAVLVHFKPHAKPHPSPVFTVSSSSPVKSFLTPSISLVSSVVLARIMSATTRQAMSYSGLTSR